MATNCIDSFINYIYYHLSHRFQHGFIECIKSLSIEGQKAVLWPATKAANWNHSHAQCPFDIVSYTHTPHIYRDIHVHSHTYICMYSEAYTCKTTTTGNCCWHNSRVVLMPVTVSRRDIYIIYIYVQYSICICICLPCIHISLYKTSTNSSQRHVSKMQTTRTQQRAWLFYFF